MFFHRRVDQSVEASTGNGFRLSALRECAPARGAFDDDAEFARRRRIPRVLLLAAEH